MVFNGNKIHAISQTAAAGAFFVLTMVLCGTGASALTPANTVISISNLQVSASGSISLSKPSTTPSITVKAVSGIAWQVTPVAATLLSGQTTTYQYRFVHNGNIGINPVTDNFYITVTGAWLNSVCQDALCAVPASSTVSLPPNAGNTYTFYVKVAVPAGSDGLTSTTTVQIDNEYYNANGANDPYGDPDRITHSVATVVSDVTPPALAVTSPVSNTPLTVSSASVTGTTEIGATGFISLSPSGATQALVVAGNGSFSQAVNFSQGTNTVTVQARDAATNLSIATRTFFVDSVPPSAVISSPAQLAAVSGSVTITGDAIDANFKEYSLKYGPGLSPSAWGTITATNTAAVNAGTLGTWNAANLFGDYTLLLTAVDILGNTTTAKVTVSIGSSSAISATIPAGQWTMVSIPGIPYNPDPASFLGSGRYEAQRWNPNMATADPYLYQYEKAFSVNAGTGFWVKPYGTAISYNVPAWVTNTTQKYSIPVFSGWNQVGNPYNRDMQWDLFSVKNSTTGATLDLLSAIQQNWVDGKFYSYDNNNYTMHSLGENLTPGKGYFIKSFVSGELIIDPGAGKPGGVAKIIRPQYDWKLQLSAKAGDLKDTDNFAGVLKGSSDSLDAEDSGEPPLVEPYLSLYFNHEDWAGAFAGRYAKDVRPAPLQQDPALAPVKTWTFTVKSSEPGTAVVVSWPDSSQLPENYDIEITDDTTGAKIDPKRTTDYSYVSADSSPRNFTLTARKLGTLPELSLPFTLSGGWNLISVPLEPDQTDARAQLRDSLPDAQIYQFYDRKINGTDSAEGVDIQAGLGYWVYTDSPAQVSFKGVPTSPDKPVEVPLSEGWNLVGNPYDEPIGFGDNIKVTRENETLALSEAAQRGWVEERIFHFNAATDGYDTLGAGAQLKPREGYVIKAAAKCVVRFER